MSRIYVYKLTTDDNGAPCVDDAHKLLSLAICKPMIRSTAKVDDLIFGFAGNSLYADNILIYIACVTEKLLNGVYYTDLQYSRRLDCIYERCGDRFQWRKDALRHSPDDLIHDIGDYPEYKRNNTLLSTDFRYFGKNGDDSYKEYPLIKELIEKLGRPYRVNHGEELRKELKALKTYIWEKYPLLYGRALAIAD